MNIKRTTTLFLGIIIFFLLGSCSPHDESLTITENDQGKTIEIQKGSLLNVELEGNPTTGYIWEVAPGSTKILLQTDEPTFTNSSDALGAGGTITIKFKAQETGEGILKLIYHRPWEENVSPERAFSVKIIIK